MTDRKLSWLRQLVDSCGLEETGSQETGSHSSASQLAPSEVDLCDHCKGKTQADCRVHGIAAANARQNEFLRNYDKRYLNG